MVNEVVCQVLADNTNRRVSVDPKLAERALPPVLQKAKEADAQAKEDKPKRKVIRAGSACPLCGEGKVIKGKTAYGCSRWKEGCTFRKPFKK
ncbi:DNA topoisomerase III [gut metagenome]|uniref:DNA topoisomerase III n=1 Tax=gut metagenome TaxID=749906 RepID=J9FYM4_9ZZZZ